MFSLVQGRGVQGPSLISMRLLHLQMDYPPRMAGGTTIHTYQLAKAEVAEGHEVTVIAAVAKGAPLDEVSEGVHVIRVKGAYTLSSGRAATKVLKDIDIVHGHGTCTRGHLSHNKGFPTVVKMHNTWLGELEKHVKTGSPLPLSRKAAMRLYTRMDRYCVKHADHIIAISKLVRDETLRYGIPESKITVIYNGIDLERFNVPEAKRAALRKKLGYTDKDIVVSYIGRVEPHKNIPSLVQAIIAMKGHEEVKLMVVGDGNVMEDVQAQAAPLKERAKFMGMISYDDIPQYYAASDIIVFPSIYEGLGNVVLEAMASCRPILASDVNGINEAFVKGTGYLFEPNAAAIKEKLEEVVADEGLRRTMGEKGRKAVAANSWRNVAKKTVAVCKTVLDRQ
jgi:glycogen(starch) synthase